MRPIVAVLVAGSLLAGCTTSDDGSSPRSASEQGRFVRSDLDAIVLTPVDAPDGTEYSSVVSGFQDIDAFASSTQEKRALVEDRFVVGHLALFAPEGHAVPGQGGPLPDDAPFAQGIAGLFIAGDGASRALNRFAGDLRTRQFSEVDDIGSLGFGDEGFALEGRSAASHLVVYAWRDDNLVLAVMGAGSIPGSVIRGLARSVHDRSGSPAP
jgi:hypothetical protein